MEAFNNEVVKFISENGKKISLTLKEIVKAAIFVIIIKAFVLNISIVQGDSMYPTLNDGDRIILWQLFYTPSLFDIVVLEHTDGSNHVKRVLGTPGDRVDYINGEMLINGEFIYESYIYGEPSVRGFILEQICHFDVCYVIPDGYFLVLGDYRNNSGDSRNYGLVHRSQIVGRGILRVAPLSGFGTFN